MVQRILTQRSWNTDLAQVVQQDPDTVVQQDPDTVVQKDPDTDNCSDPDTSGPKDPDTEILYKWSYRILIQVVQKDPHTEILSEILHKCQQVVQKDPDAEVLLQMSCEFTFASRRCTLTRTVWGLLPGYIYIYIFFLKKYIYIYK